MRSSILRAPARRRRRTRIIATLGPSSESDGTIRELVHAGVDVFRLNFSHGTQASHAEAIRRVRHAAAEAGRPVAILQDLSGPKIRTGRLRGGQAIALAAGDELVIGIGDFEGEPGRISTTYSDLLKVVRPGDTLLLDDGHIQLRVEQNDGRELRTNVVDGGSLGERKGINAPGVALPATGLTPKDLDDAAFGVRAGVDLVAMSFVQRAADLRQLRAALDAAGAPGVPVIAKLERPEAVERLEEILAACDGVMVARGDLGLEVPLEAVPRIQKDVVRRARASGIPVIIATQVFESMRGEPRPTRAEVSDAANAVDDRVDAIMLAGETAAGLHPVRAVETLARVIMAAEAMPGEGVFPLERAVALPAHGEALCRAAVTLAEAGSAGAIVALTRAGKTARVLSALRPVVPIYAVTDQETVARRLALAWGVVPVIADLKGDFTDIAVDAARRLGESGDVPPGALLVLVSVTPELAPGPSNVLKVLRVGGP